MWKSKKRKVLEDELAPQTEGASEIQEPIEPVAELEEVATEALAVPDVEDELSEASEAGEKKCCAKRPSGHVVRNAAFAAVFVGGAAVAGSLFTDPSSTWYKKQSKPEWQPKQELFPIVWTGLYGLTGLASVRVLSRLRRRDLKKEEGAYRRALVTNMTINAAWPFMYFQKKDLGAAALTAAGLAASSAVLVSRAKPAGRTCQLALVPYLAWNTFAMGLSSELWLRNR